MTEEEPTSTGGDRRGRDRRKRDRRKSDRRTPAPWWRRPLALVSYGVAATLAAVLVVSLISPGPGREERVAAADEGVTDAEELPPPREAGEADPAFTSADFDRLIAEGSDARGRVIRVELFCESIQMISVRQVDDPDPRIAVLTDEAGRIPGAECRWGRRGEDRREAFFLVIPPRAVDLFASAPTVEDGFVLRRHVVADVTWIGRTEELSLRTAGVLRPPAEG